MPQYAVFIDEDEAVREDHPQPRQQEVVDGYRACAASVGPVCTAAQALHPTSTATTVPVREGRTSTGDGPFIKSKEALGGFPILTAGDLGDAIALAAGCPGARTGAVQVRPVVDVSAG